MLARRGVEFDTVEYLKNPLSRAELEKIAAMLEGPIGDLVRKDKRFGELGLNAGDYVARGAVLDLLAKHPELMQRPIVIRGRRAVIARPSEKLLALFE